MRIIIKDISDRQTDRQIDGWMDGWMDGWIDVDVSHTHPVELMVSSRSRSAWSGGPLRKISSQSFLISSSSSRDLLNQSKLCALTST